jgi:branched-subunit amino acid transport protein
MVYSFWRIDRRNNSLLYRRKEMTINVLLAILVTSLATYSSRFLGVITSEKIKETSKIFRWFNCLAYSTLAALIARVVIFPLGVLSEVDYLVRIIVIISSIIIFYLTKKNLVYPTIFSAIILALLNSYFV